MLQEDKTLHQPHEICDNNQVQTYLNSENQENVQDWTTSKVGNDKKESPTKTHDTLVTAVKSKPSESIPEFEANNMSKQTKQENKPSKQIIVERTVTHHETMEVISSSVHQISQQHQKVTKTSSEKHQKVTKISSEQRQHVSKSEYEIPPDAEIEKQIDDFVKSTTEEEAKALLEQISASQSVLFFLFFAFMKGKETAMLAHSAPLGLST